MQTIAQKVENLIVGNRVDLESCPFLKAYPSASDEYAYVAHIEKEAEGTIVIGYEGIDHVGYPLGTELQVRVPQDVPDPIVRVQLVADNGAWVDWNFAQNLTDRYGDLNYHNAEQKPLELLSDNEPLLERLVDQMWGESTFVTRKDGAFGILFEVEFCSRESEQFQATENPEWFAKLKPHAEVVKDLIEGLKLLVDQFPGVLFAVPDPEVVINDRPVAWAFVPDGHLTAEQRNKLGEALHSL